MADIITQVSPNSGYGTGYERQSNIDYESKIQLNFRGNSFTITRDELMSLPESILLCLFPNGVFLDSVGQAITNLTEEDTVFVNFEPSSFKYIINTFGQARLDLIESPAANVLLPVTLPGLTPSISKQQSESAASVLQNKPAIIVLREDLDYYVIPPIAGLDADNIRQCKIAVAQYLIANKQIFSGLGYDPSKDPSVHQQLGAAEQHLLDMLCASGFQTTGEWGARSMEPGKCVILSLSLVRLQNNPPPLPAIAAQNSVSSPPDSPLLLPVASNVSVSSTPARKSRSRIASLASSATRAASRSLSKSRRQENQNHSKLLLFWRKPARKCWWSNETIEIDVEGMVVGGVKYDKLSVKVHIRRVWTLELSVIGVQ